MNNPALARLREMKPHLGTWLSSGSTVVAELAADSGFDWLLFFDLEHGCGTDAEVLPQPQAIRGTTAAAIVRVGGPHPDLIGRVLDWGADGIMVPRVTSVTEAEACVRAALYPPRGRRGLARITRATHYGMGAPEMSTSPFIFVQIESSEAVESARDIAKVDGIDVLFVGPADLRIVLEAHPEKATRYFEGCLREFSAAASAAGRQSGILLRGADEIARLRDLGFTKLAIDSDLGILRAGHRQIVETGRAALSAS